MAQILQSKNLATRFQILVEIAANQPTVHQKSIAAKLNVTPQAISEYMMKLEQDGWVASDGRSKYRVTQEGINWVLQMLREITTYADYVQQAITNVTVCAAVADSDLKQSQPVGLTMKDGVLVATADVGTGAKGIVVSGAKTGEDVGVSGIEGIVEFQKGNITILKVPDIQGGGSAKTDLKRLKKEIGSQQMLGAIGIEALVAIRRAGVEPRYTCGVTEAAVEATHIGLSFSIVCSEDAIPNLIAKLRDENLNYQMVDLGL
jgi:putative transcriptional regulator